MDIFFPYQITDSGTTSTTGIDTHIRNLIEQVLFTNAGERVNRPTFGGGAVNLVFGPNSDEVATTMEFVLQSALLEWMGALIRVKSVTAECDDATLRIEVVYGRTHEIASRTVVFERERALL